MKKLSIVTLVLLISTWGYAKDTTDTIDPASRNGRAILALALDESIPDSDEFTNNGKLITFGQVVSVTTDKCGDPTISIIRFSFPAKKMIITAVNYTFTLNPLGDYITLSVCFAVDTKSGSIREVFYQHYTKIGDKPLKMAEGKEAITMMTTTWRVMLGIYN